MILALGLLLGAITVGTVGPFALRRLAVPRRHPALVMAAWTGSLLTAMVAFSAAAVVLVLPDPSVPAGALGVAHACLRAAVHGEALPWVVATRLLLGVTVGAVVVRFLTVAVTMTRADRAARARRYEALDLVARSADGVWWVPGDRPLAYSMGGRSPRVVASSALATLEDADRYAVLAHERAHVRGRHHLVVRFAVVAATALPRVPLFRAAPAAIRLLVEMSADAEASRRCGQDAVASALHAVASGPPGRPHASGAILGITDEQMAPILRARLAWLGHRHGARIWARSHGARAIAFATSAVPVIALVGALAALVGLWCATGLA